MNRLSKEGTIKKVRRGRFSGIQDIDHESISKLYSALFDTLYKGIGEQVISNLIALSPKSFDAANPVDSLNTLVSKIREVFGDEMAMNMFNAVLTDEFKDETTVIKMRALLN